MFFTRIHLFFSSSSNNSPSPLCTSLTAVSFSPLSIDSFSPRLFGFVGPLNLWRELDKRNESTVLQSTKAHSVLTLTHTVKVKCSVYRRVACVICFFQLQFEKHYLLQLLTTHLHNLMTCHAKRRKVACEWKSLERRAEQKSSRLPVIADAVEKTQEEGEEGGEKQVNWSGWPLLLLLLLRAHIQMT